MTVLLEVVHDAPSTADVALMRRAVRAAAEAAAVPIDTADLELVVSELAANAVLHGAPPVRIVLVELDDGVRLTVTDAAADALPPEPPDAAREETGRGLMVVAAVATRWGWQVDADGASKTVWVELLDAS